MKHLFRQALLFFLLFTMIIGTLPAYAAEGDGASALLKTADSVPTRSASESAAEETPAFDYGALYVQEGLVGLFTAFRGGDTVNTSTGVWKNEKSGHGDATLRGAEYWTRKNFGVGYRMDVATWDKNASKVGLSLPEKFENYDSFSVEVFATVEGLTDENGDRIVNEYNAETGTGRRYGYYKSGLSAFRFELLSSLFFVSLDTNPNSSLTSRWYLLNRGYPGAVPSAAESETVASTDGGWGAGVNELPTASVMHVGKTTARYDVTYSVGYNDNPTCYETTVTKERRAELLGYSSKDGAGRFSLFNGLPATVYAVRVYNRTLTEKEKNINGFVDKAAYHGIDLSDFSALDDATRERVYGAFSHLDLNTDTERMKEAYRFAVEGKETVLIENLGSFVGYRPILSGAMGYRVLFRLDRNVYDMFAGLGYTVRYGAVVSCENTTPVLNESGTVRIDVNGEYGSHLYSELAGAGGWVYSIALTGEDNAELAADVSVRGYVEITDKDGKSSVLYVDPYENEVLDGRVSIKDTAAYFVNKFDGEVATSYAYMNSASLRAVLAAFGIAGRYTLADDLTLYVDAQKGDDANGGQSADRAYASLSAAFAGAKAHLGKRGRKTVTIRLSAGRHYVHEELTLSGSEILADAYSLTLVGEGDDTVITSEKLIDLDGCAYDPDLKMSYVQLPQNADGTYPHFRAVYGDGELLDIAHRGTSEETHAVTDFYILDGAGQKLPTVGNDWVLSDADAARAKYGVMHLPLDVLNEKVDPALYAGAELHFIVYWTSHMAHIDHVEVMDDHVRVYLPYHEIPSFNKSYTIKKSPVWLMNDDALLYDHPDTYYYDSARGRVYYHEGDMRLDGFSSFAYASLERIFFLKDVTNFGVEDLRFTGVDSKYITPTCGVGCGQGTNTAIHHRDPAIGKKTVGFMEAAPIFAKSINGLTLSRVTVDGTLGSGVVCKGRVENVVIDSCTFTNLGNSAIHLGDSSYTKNTFVKGVEITNNYVSEIGTLYPASVAVIGTIIANARVVGNTVVSVPYSAFSFGWMWSTVDSSAEEIVEGDPFDTFGIEIAYNYVSDFMTATGDGGAFYLLGGTVRRAERDKTPYNFMHHNYVLVTERTARHNGRDTTVRNVMCYYHDNSSSNWLDADNVLIHGAKGKPTYRGVYHQSIVDCEAQNNRMVNNYFVGFSSLLEIHRGSTNTLMINSQFGIEMSDYVYPSVEDLLYNRSIGAQSTYSAATKNSPSDAASTVATVFATSGSSLSTEGKQSGLSWGASAAERVFYLDAGDLRVGAVGENSTCTVTVTDGTKSVTLSVRKGETLGMPEGFTRVGHRTVFKAYNLVIDPESFLVFETMKVYVSYKPNSYPVRFYSVIHGAERVYEEKTVEFGSTVSTPTAPAGYRDENGELYVFDRWEGYTEGMLLETEGASFLAVFRKDGAAEPDNGNDGDVTLPDMGDGVQTPQTEKTPVGATVGIVLGVTAGVAVLAVLIMLILKKKK